DPELLLIDEPTASLDPKTSRQIMRLIREICAERNLPAIINIHDVVLAQAFVDGVVGLRAGEVVFDGLPNALSPEGLTRIYGEEGGGNLAEPQGPESRGRAKPRRGDRGGRMGPRSQSRLKHMRAWSAPQHKRGVARR